MTTPDTGSAAPPQASIPASFASLCQLVANIATIVAVIVLIVQVSEAKNEIARSLQENRVNRTAEWVTRLLGSEDWKEMNATYSFLTDSHIDSVKRLDSIGKDMHLQGQIIHTLADIEFLSYMYNANKIDKAIVRHVPRHAIVAYWDAALPYVAAIRRVEGKPDMYVDIDSMVANLRDTTAWRDANY